MAYIQKLLQSLSPRHGSQNNSVNSVVELTFATPMNADTLHQDTIYLQDEAKNKVDVTYQYRKTESKLVLTPKAPLLEEHAYGIKIRSGNQGPLDFLGRMVVNDLEFGFTTGIKSESDTEIIEEPEEPEAPVEKPVEPEEVPEDPPNKTPEDIPLPELDYNDVLSTYPKKDEIWDSTQPIAIQFSKEVDISSLQNISVYIKPLSQLLERAEEIPMTKTLSKDKTIVYLKATGTIPPGTEFSVEVNDNLAFVDGTTLDFPYQFVILSQAEYFFTSVNNLKLVAGQFASGYTDIQLAQLIAETSKNLSISLGALDIYEGQDFTVISGSVPNGAGQYVLYSVLYQMILGSSLATASGSSKSIRLGDLSVEGSEKVSDNLAELLGLLKKELDRWWSVLITKDPTVVDSELYTNWHRTITSAVRGGSISPYPDFQTRVPFNSLGG